LEKRAVKNRRMIRVELHPNVIEGAGGVAESQGGGTRKPIAFFERDGESTELGERGTADACRSFRAGESGPRTPTPLPPHARQRDSRERRDRGGCRRHPCGQPRDDPPTLREVDARVPGPSGPGNSDDPWHKSGTGGRAGQQVLNYEQVALNH